MWRGSSRARGRRARPRRAVQRGAVPRGRGGGGSRAAQRVRRRRARSGRRSRRAARSRRPAARERSQARPPDRRLERPRRHREVRAQLHEAVDRIRYQRRVLDEWGFLRGRRGARGVRMLLTGPPGTGKTLAAEVLARELESDLLVVDLANLVSKWIGETEKNLAEVFDAAERLAGDASVRRGRRALRQTHRGLRRARPVREPRDGVPALPDRALRGPRPSSPRTSARTSTRRSCADSSSSSSSASPTPAERERLWRCHLPPAAPLDDDVDLTELATLFPARRRDHPQRRGRRGLPRRGRRRRRHP